MVGTCCERVPGLNNPEVCRSVPNNISQVVHCSKIMSLQLHCVVMVDGIHDVIICIVSCCTENQNVFGGVD